MLDLNQAKSSAPLLILTLATIFKIPLLVTLEHDSKILCDESELESISPIQICTQKCKQNILATAISTMFSSNN